MSTAGSALTDLAAGILVFQLTHSALAVGLTLMATAVPSLLVGLIAGVFVDRFDRRRIMLACNVIQAALVALIPLVISVNVLWIYLIILLSAGVKQFFDPANQSLVPDIATDEELTAANSLLQIASFGSNAIGFAGAGILASIDIRLAFWIDAATFLVSASCIWFVRTRANAAPEEDTTVAIVVENLREGVATLLGTPILRTLFLLAIPYVFSVGLWNVLSAAVRLPDPGRQRVPVRPPGGAHVGGLRDQQPAHGALRLEAQRGQLDGRRGDRDGDRRRRLRLHPIDPRGDRDRHGLGPVELAPRGGARDTDAAQHATGDARAGLPSFFVCAT